jgi:hypothetical protein
MNGQKSAAISRIAPCSVRAGRQRRCFPLEAAAENFRRFLKRQDMLADVEDDPDFRRRDTDRNIGGS